MQFISSNKRRVYFKLVDATDGLTPESGEAAGQPQISVYGADYANTSATLTAVDSGTNGSYYIDLSTTEYASILNNGQSLVRYKSANTAEFEDVVKIQQSEEVSNDQLRSLISALSRKVNWIEQVLNKSSAAAIAERDISVT